MPRSTKELFPIIILLLRTRAVAAKRGIVFICFSDCAWWEYLLMTISGLIFLCCVCAGAARCCCPGSNERDEMRWNSGNEMGMENEMASNEMRDGRAISCMEEKYLDKPY